MKTTFNCQLKNVRHFSCILLFLLGITVGCSNEDVFEEVVPESFDQLLTKGSLETDAFVTEWYIPKDTTIYFILDTNYRYNCIIDWGDDSPMSYIFSKEDYYLSKHIYYEPGIYRIRILGTFPIFQIGWNCCNFLKKIIQWGNVKFDTYSSAFHGCNELISIPSGIPDAEDYSDVFGYCSNLTSLPDGLFSNSVSAKTFNDAFNSCENLEILPPNLFAASTECESFDATFAWTNLKVLPRGLFKNCRKAKDFGMVFAFCFHLTTIPDDLFSDCPEVWLFSKAFWECNLTSIPITLFDNCKKVTDFSGTFSGCSSLTGHTPKTGPLELWNRAGKPGYPASVNGTGCFSGCQNLTEWTNIPADWK